MLYNTLSGATDFVIADDLSGRIDAVGLGVDGPGESENGVGAMTVEKGFLSRIAPALKRPDDLAVVVDAPDIDVSDIGGMAQLSCRCRCCKGSLARARRSCPGKTRRPVRTH